LECDIDRSLEITYCAADILEVMIQPKNGIAHTYLKLLNRYFSDSGIGRSERQSTVLINDFKPLWAIKRSMN
jgi:hypothetical protein